MNSNLSYQEKCECEQSTFCTYVEGLDKYSREEKDYLTKRIVGNDLSGILFVSSALVAWSFIAGIVDFVFFPGVIVYAFIHGVIDFKVLFPPIAFLLLNFSAKLFYIAFHLKGKLKFNDVFISALPYVGSAYLLKKFLINDQLLSKAVVSYLKMKKQNIKKQFSNIFKSNK